MFKFAGVFTPLVVCFTIFLATVVPWVVASTSGELTAEEASEVTFRVQQHRLYYKFLFDRTYV